MKLHPIFLCVLLIYLATNSYGQLPVITPNPPPVILGLGPTRGYTVKLRDIAKVMTPDGSEPEVSLTPTSFDCSKLGPQKVAVVAYNITHRTPTTVNFERPEGLAFDSKGNLYVAEDGHDVRKIDPAGNVTLFAGINQVGFADGPAATARFNSVINIVVDAADNLYVTDAGNARVRKIDINGHVSTIAGTGVQGTQDGPGNMATFTDPEGIALDHNGNIYITDELANNVRKISSAGVVSTIAGNGQSGYIDGPGINAEFSFPTGISVDAKGNVFICDANNHVLRKITPQGEVSTFAGGASAIVDGLGAAAGFNLPQALCMDAKGNLFMGDYLQVRKVTPAGEVTTIAGTVDGGSADGPGPTAGFFVITGIYVDKYGVIYVADPNNSKVRQVCTDSVVSTLAGDGTRGIQNGNIGSIKISDCPAKAVIPVDVEDPTGDCEIKKIFIPNTFTPNGDGHNDVWSIPGLITYPYCKVQIFNRYGELLFKSTGYVQPWDGTYNGKPVPSGAYYYIIKLTEAEAPLSGSVMIIK